jgi:hypothetical protein
MTVKKKLLISLCSLLIILNLVNCVFFDGTKFGCVLNVLAMIFIIMGIVKSKDGKYN